jgi:hypothetical protein
VAVVTEVAEVMARPITQQLLRDEPLMRFAYTGLDGAPRVIPLAYLWDGTSLLFWTNTISAKVRALQADPRVAVTIDVIGPPPRVLLARGTAELTTVDGVPDGYLQASHRTTPPEAWDDFDTQVHGLYTQMVAVRITPTWAKLLDFETTAPSAVEQLVRERSQ